MAKRDKARESPESTPAESPPPVPVLPVRSWTQEEIDALAFVTPSDVQETIATRTPAMRSLMQSQPAVDLGELEE